jgi:signal transduction histidine kinase
MRPRLAHFWWGSVFLVNVPIAVAHQLVFLGFILLWINYPWWAPFLWVLACHLAIVSLGLYARARRRLVESLHEQVRQAEAAKHLMAEQARRAERARIAVEMHDVLAHRVSLMALHAGALEVRPDLAPDAVRETAGLIRSTARQALTELRDVIGVLRDADDGEAPYGPQPRLADIAHLVGGYCQAWQGSARGPVASTGPARCRFLPGRFLPGRFLRGRAARGRPWAGEPG